MFMANTRILYKYTMRTRDDEADEVSKMNVNEEDNDERNNTEIQNMITSGHMGWGRWSIRDKVSIE